MELFYSYNKTFSLFSSVAEHWSRKPGVVSSTLTGGNFLKFFLKQSYQKASLFLFDQKSIQLLIRIIALSAQGSLAEWSKALVLGTSPKGRGFESHSCQILFVLAFFFTQ